MVRDYYLTFASFPAHIVSCFHLSLKIDFSLTALAKVNVGNLILMFLLTSGVNDAGSKFTADGVDRKLPPA